MATLIKQAAWMVGNPTNEKVVLLYNEGVKPVRIAEMVGLGRQRISQILDAERRAEEYEAYAVFHPDDESIWMLKEPLTIRAYNATRSLEIKTKAEYLALDRVKIAKVKNLGIGTFNELEEKLAGRPPVTMRGYLALLRS